MTATQLSAPVRVHASVSDCEALTILYADAATHQVASGSEPVDGKVPDGIVQPVPVLVKATVAPESTPVMANLSAFACVLVSAPVVLVAPLPLVELAAPSYMLLGAIPLNS